MLKVGDRFPAYALKAVDAKSTPETFHELSNASLGGKWGVYFFWPKDFTFVCPTEIVGFDALNGELADRDAQLVGVSTDSEFVHLAWRHSRDDLGKVGFPWLDALKQQVAPGSGRPDGGAGR